MPLELPEEIERVATAIVGSVGEVRRELGAGLAEAVYVECLTEELRLAGLRVDREVPVPLSYKGRALGRTVRLDMIVDDVVVVEAKAVLELHPSHYAQLLTYLRLSGRPLGFLVNFSAVPLATGIHRRINRAVPPPP